jgi:DNA-binding NarL/FixJ family response regulator
MAEKNIKIAIAEDHAMIRKAWVMMLGELENVAVVGEVPNGRELIQLLEKKTVDIVLMDIDMPLMNGIEATEIIKNRCPWVKVIALTMQKEFAFLKRIFSLGAMGFITKNSSKEELFIAIQAVSEGRRYVCDELNGALLDKLSYVAKPSFDKESSKSNLTRREIEIVRLISEGLTSRDIAQRLFLSLKTVEAHRGNVFRKLKVKNVAEMLKKVREQSLV